MKLVVGNLNYSSWSVRPWLALDHAAAPFTIHRVELFVDPRWREKVLQFSGAAKVPVLVDGALSVHESLAICEYVNERFPEARLWPEDGQLRARARAVSQEMATGFPNVRNELSMNFRARTSAIVPSEAARAEIDRVFDLWDASLETSGGPFLFGAFSIADCMYLPMACRFQTYGVPLRGHAAAYTQALLAHPSAAKWARIAEAEPPLPKYDALLG